MVVVFDTTNEFPMLMSSSLLQGAGIQSGMGQGASTMGMVRGQTGMPGQGMQGQGMPGQGIQGQGMPGQGMPGQGMAAGGMMQRPRPPNVNMGPGTY